MYLTSQRLGTWLEFFARGLAVLAALAYTKGYYVGQQVHRFNDLLALKAPWVYRPTPVGPILETLKAELKSVWYYAPNVLVDYLHPDA